MNPGCFSISLAVKDLQKSKQFYESLGFEKFHGEESQGWLIMKNGTTNIGLFQGMFENNILTFNPGWDQNSNSLDKFDDIRQIQKDLEAKGIQIPEKVDENSKGPASIVITDPDGNAILIDQHV